METTKNENEDISQNTGEQLELPFDSAEIDTLRAENERLKTEGRTRAARDTMLLALSQAGARDPELMFRAVKDELQFGEDDALENAAALVGRLKREYPEQFGSRSIDGGAGMRAPQYLTKETLARMSPTEIARLDWGEVRRVLSER